MSLSEHEGPFQQSQGLNIRLKLTMDLFSFNGDRNKIMPVWSTLQFVLLALLFLKKQAPKSHVSQ